MFYLILSIISLILIGTFCVLKYAIFKNSEKFNIITNKVLKILAIVYASIMLISILLPDAFCLCFSQEELASSSRSVSYILVRWFSMVSFVVLPLSIFFKNRTIKNIAIYFSTIITIISVFFYPQYLSDFTSTMGRGLNSIPVISAGFKNFLINPTFRSIWFGIILFLQFSIPVVLALQEKHIFNFKNKNEYINFFIILPLVILSIIPIYVPQHLFGYTNLILEAYGVAHICWLLLIIIEIVAMFFIFRKKDMETKNVLLFVLSLSLIMQYLQMFSAISINIERLPLQLCNIGSFFILISLITKNKKIFNFTVIINVVGVLFALAMPDLDGKGLFYLYNMHFMLEHGNVLIIPILALMLNVFPRLDKKALRDCLVGFGIYFVAVWSLGTMFNAISSATGNGFYTANYLFMFLPEKAAKLLPFTKALFDINFKIGYATFYPVIQLIIFVVFCAVCVLLFFAIQLIYYIIDKVKKPKQVNS